MSFVDFEHVSEEKQQNSSCASTRFHTHDLGEQVILTNVLLNKKLHSSLRRPKVHGDVSAVVSTPRHPPLLHHTPQSLVLISG